MRDNFKFNAGYLFFRIIQNQRDISFTYNKKNKCIDYLVDSFVGYTVHLLLEKKKKKIYSTIENVRNKTMRL